MSSTSPISLGNVHNLDAAFKAAGLSVVYENDAIPFNAFDATKKTNHASNRRLRIALVASKALNGMASFS